MDRAFRNSTTDAMEEQPNSEDATSSLLTAIYEGLQVADGVSTSGDGLRGASLYVGKSGLALTYLRVARALERQQAHGAVVAAPSDPSFRGATPAELRIAALVAVEQAEAALGSRPRLAFLDGLSGVLATKVAVLSAVGRQRDALLALQALLDLRQQVEATPPGECEFLYGRAGYLYALLWARQCCFGRTQHGSGGGGGPHGRQGASAAGIRGGGSEDVVHVQEAEGRSARVGKPVEGEVGVKADADAVADEAAAAAVAGELGDAVKSMVRHLVDTGRRTAEEGSEQLRSFGLMFSWHDKHYLGAAHGLAGILHTLLLASEEVAAEYPDGSGLGCVAQAASALIDALLDSANLPSSVGNASDRLVQWCHGSPGLLPLLQAVAVSGHSPPLGPGLESPGRRMPVGDALRHAADCVWYRGLLKKGVGLCHGISGNGYALLAAYQATGDDVYRRRAMQYALFAAGQWRELYHIPDRPLSLYEGLCGAICYWADMLQPELGSFPAYQLPPPGEPA